MSENHFTFAIERIGVPLENGERDEYRQDKDNSDHLVLVFAVVVVVAVVLVVVVGGGGGDED